MGQAESASCQMHKSASVGKPSWQNYLISVRGKLKRALLTRALATAQVALDSPERKTKGVPRSPRTENKGPALDKQHKLAPPFRKTYSDVPCWEREDAPAETKRGAPPDSFRLSYLRKLSSERVWVPAAERPPKHQTVTIFDWDDTLLCTTFLSKHEGKNLDPITKRLLKDIEKASSRLLEKACEMGNTFIITNGTKGWVEFSAARYVPGLLAQLKKVTIISARERYQELYPNDVGQWKIHAFLDLQRKLNLPIVTNLNSLGDAKYEMKAARIMGAKFKEAFVKTFKFQENPTPDELLKQLELVLEGFESVVGRAVNLKISLGRREC